MLDPKLTFLSEQRDTSTVMELKAIRSYHYTLSSGIIINLMLRFHPLDISHKSTICNHR